LFSNLSRTSPIAFVGFANIGFSGTPGVSLQWSRSPSMPRSSNAGTTLSYVGSSLAGKRQRLFSSQRRYYDLTIIPVYRLDNIGTFFQSLGQLFAAPLLSTYASHQIRPMPLEAGHSLLSFSAKTAACASATKTERSAFPILSLPSRLRTIYFASKPWQLARSLVMTDTFFA
jgi:hypothetical protein